MRRQEGGGPPAVRRAPHPAPPVTSTRSGRGCGGTGPRGRNASPVRENNGQPRRHPPAMPPPPPPPPLRTGGLRGAAKTLDEDHHEQQEAGRQRVRELARCHRPAITEPGENFPVEEFGPRYLTPAVKPAPRVNDFLPRSRYKTRSRQFFKMTAVSFWLCVLALAALPGALGFYLPGVAPHEYADGEAVEIKAVKLTSAKRPLPCVRASLSPPAPSSLFFLKPALWRPGTSTTTCRTAGRSG